MIYLYGVLEPNAEPDAAWLTQQVGVTGPLDLIQLQCGWLIYGTADSDEILPKRRFLLRHTKVLEDLMALGALLPMRFGMFAETPEGVGELLTAQSSQIEEQFSIVRGHVELGVRIEFPREPALQATLNANPGLNAEHARLKRKTRQPHFEVAEFGRRLAEALDQQRGRTQKAIVSTLAPLCKSYVLKAPESDVQVLALDVLIEQDAQADFAQAVEAAASKNSAFAMGSDPEIRLVGPVPPFNFVTLILSDRTSEAA